MVDNCAVTRSYKSGRARGGVLHPRFQPVVERRAMPAMKAELIASQLIGLAMTRYVLKIEPLASAPVDDVVAMVAPALTATLQGPDTYLGSGGPARLRGPRLPGAGAVRRTAARVRGRA